MMVDATKQSLVNALSLPSLLSFPAFSQLSSKRPCRSLANNGARVQKNIAHRRFLLTKREEYVNSVSWAYLEHE